MSSSCLWAYPGRCDVVKKSPETTFPLVFATQRAPSPRALTTTLLSPLSLSCLMTVAPDFCFRVVPPCSVWSTTPKTERSLATFERDTTGRASDDLMARVPVVKDPLRLTYLFLLAETTRPWLIGPSGKQMCCP